ncbi:recombinase family protein [Streptomyces sp. CA-243310]|uniref:recombinase family protein n=1 Tax=Streptomyces sp. CA-243310 TaxID=3240056 RepID=UPI003D8BA385
MTITQTPATFQGSRGNREPWVGYIRVSTYYEDKISPDIQRAAIKAWADRTNRYIAEWVEDLDVSGRTFKRKIMIGIKTVEEKRARGIAVWRYSRFGRSRHGNAVNLARLEQVGGRLESATESADTTTAFGRLQMGMAFKFAEFESDRIGEQWAETREHRRAHGLPATGGRRWGFIWHRRRLDEEGVIHPETYEPAEDLGLVVGDLYERAADGQSMNSLTQWLGRNGYIGTKGKPWHQTGLSKYMDSGFPAGWLRYHPDDCDCPPADPDGNAHRSALCVKKVFMPGAQTLIVKEDVWEEYQRKRKLAQDRPARNRAAVYPSSGLAVCGRCGGATTAGNSSTRGAGGVLISKPGYLFRCSARKDNGTCDGVYILRSIVEAAILERLGELEVEIETEAAKIAEEAAKQPKKRGEEPATTAGRLEQARKQHGARLAQIQQELDTQTSLVSRGIIPEDSYVRERNRLTAEQESVAAELAELDNNAGKQEADRGEYLPVIRGLITRWAITPVATRRALLRTLLRGVWAYPEGTGPKADASGAYAVAVAIWEEAPAPVGRRAAA